MERLSGKILDGVVGAVGNQVEKRAEYACDVVLAKTMSGWNDDSAARGGDDVQSALLAIIGSTASSSLEKRGPQCPRNAERESWDRA